MDPRLSDYLSRKLRPYDSPDISGGVGSSGTMLPELDVSTPSRGAMLPELDVSTPSRGTTLPELDVSNDAKLNPWKTLEPGNIDMTSRPHVRNDDGSISTVRSMSFEDDDGKEVLVPTVSDDGRIMSDEDAISTYRASGHHLGKFANADDATAYAKNLHNSEAAKLDAWKKQNPDFEKPRSSMLPELDVSRAEESSPSGKLHDTSADESPGIDPVTHSGDEPAPTKADQVGEWSMPDELLLRDRVTARPQDPDAEISAKAREYLLKRIASEDARRAARQRQAVAINVGRAIMGQAPQAAPEESGGLDRELMSWLQGKDKTAASAQASEERGAEASARAALQSQLAQEREARIAAQFGQTLNRQKENDEWAHTRTQQLDEQNSAKNESERRLIEAKIKKLSGGGGGGGGGGDATELQFDKGNGSFHLRPGPLLTRATISRSVLAVRNFNAALGGMEEMEKEMNGLVDILASDKGALDKMTEAKLAASRIDSLRTDIGDTLKAAYGNAASKYGMQQIERQMGAELGSADSMVAMAKSLSGNPEEARRILTNRIRAAKELTKKNAINSMSPIADWRPRAEPNQDNAHEGKVKVVSVASGNEVWLTPQVAEELKKSGKVR